MAVQSTWTRWCGRQRGCAEQADQRTDTGSRSGAVASGTPANPSATSSSVTIKCVFKVKGLVDILSVAFDASTRCLDEWTSTPLRVDFNDSAFAGPTERERLGPAMFETASVLKAISWDYRLRLS